MCNARLCGKIWFSQVKLKMKFVRSSNVQRKIKINVQRKIFGTVFFNVQRKIVEEAQTRRPCSLRLQNNGLSRYTSTPVFFVS